MKKILAALAATACLYASSAQAVTLERLTSTMVKLSGEFTEGDSDRLTRYLRLHTDTTDIMMDSPGGNASEGYQMSFVLSAHKLRAHTAVDGACMSACASAFLGAPVAAINGPLGFHRPLPINADDMTRSEISSGGLFMGAWGTQVLMSHGFSAWLTNYINVHTDQNTFIVFHDIDDLYRFYRGDPTTTNLYEYLLKDPTWEAFIQTAITTYE